MNRVGTPCLINWCFCREGGGEGRGGEGRGGEGRGGEGRGGEGRGGEGRGEEGRGGEGRGGEGRGEKRGEGRERNRVICKSLYVHHKTGTS